MTTQISYREAKLVFKLGGKVYSDKEGLNVYKTMDKHNILSEYFRDVQ